jgi:hypothetical protein
MDLVAKNVFVFFPCSSVESVAKKVLSALPVFEITL